MRRLILSPVILAGFAWLVPAAILCADCLLLKSGGEIRGQLSPELASSKTAPPELFSLRTPGGALVRVARDDVAQVITRRPLLEEYETLRRRTPETVEAQWEL